MHKIKLDVDALKVESFSTSAPEGGTGTVKGFMPPPTIYTCPDTGCESADCPTNGCPPATSYQSCYGTCNATCWDGCYLSADGGGAFTCAEDCFSHYTDCHRCP